MGRSLYLIVVLGFLSGCVPISIDPARDQFGVSTTQPAAAIAGPADPQLAELDRKARQICTTGSQGVAPTVQPAANDQQIVDQKLRCGHYDRLNLDYLHMSWANIL
ncbi:MAG TPA: hypothetical protein VG328_25410 [Stellaceae bacterium]|jgi:hypothetical protein|nr:hypothetical protein [Stellaceae bacterium]